MSKEKFTVVGLGEILWDMLPGGKQLGGAPANFAYHTKSLGAESFIISSIGNDESGKEILNKLNDLGIDNQYIIIDKKHPTGSVNVTVDKNGKPDYIISENVAWDYIPFNKKYMELAQRNDAVCFGSLCQRYSVSRDTIRRFLKSTKRQCIRIFDVNLRQSYFNKENIDLTLKLSNILKLNDEELQVISTILNIDGSETDILNRLIEIYQLGLIAVTKGSNGSRLFTKQKDSLHRGYSAKIVDTVGAGDCFAAALAIGLLKEMDLDSINDFANKAAAFVCSQKGATPEFPDRLLQSIP